MRGARELPRYGRAGSRFNAAAPLAVVFVGLLTSASAAAAPVILAFGDSLTAGYGLPQNEAFPAQLEARLTRLGVAARVVNAGVSGDTTSSALLRLDWALAGKPDLVILEEGFNDALRHLPLALVRANLDEMIKRIKASGSRVLLAGALAPRNWGERYAARFDQIYPDLARAHHVLLYPFFLDGVALQPRLNQEDGLHPNKEGAAVLAARIAPYVVRILKNEK
jgi:acyl-CoA thioesterase-1